VAVQFWQSLRADYAVNSLFDARMTLLIWRAGQSLSGRPGLLPFLLRRLYQVADFVWIKGYIGADLPPQAVAGPGIRMEHGGRGVVLHPSVRIGARATVYHQVTIGVVNDDPAATLGDDVYLGAGAKVLGHIRIGDACRIGANAVVLTDVPSGATAVGVPATIRRRRPGAASA
jgi:serine O-acetyltransferase